MEFDAKYALSENLLVQYFYEDLRYSIKLWIDEKSREIDGWKEQIWEAIKAETKAKMQLISSCDIDQRCYHGNWPVYASLDKAIKDSKIKEPKLKAQEPKASNRSLRPDQEKNAKSFDKAQKEKKKHWRQEKKKRNTNAGTSGTPPSEVNTTNNSSRKKRVQTDLSQVTCWNCNKKGYYFNNCPKPAKPKN